MAAFRNANRVSERPPMGRHAEGPFRTAWSAALGGTGPLTDQVLTAITGRELPVVRGTKLSSLITRLDGGFQKKADASAPHWQLRSPEVAGHLNGHPDVSLDRRVRQSLPSLNASRQQRSCRSAPPNDPKADVRRPRPALAMAPLRRPGSRASRRARAGHNNLQASHREP